eukprot:scpid25356/ scgid14592/ 
MMDNQAATKYCQRKESTVARPVISSDLESANVYSRRVLPSRQSSARTIIVLKALTIMFLYSVTHAGALPMKPSPQHHRVQRNAAVLGAIGQALCYSSPVLARSGLCKGVFAKNTTNVTSTPEIAVPVSLATRESCQPHRKNTTMTVDGCSASVTIISCRGVCLSNSLLRAFQGATAPSLKAWSKMEESRCCRPAETVAEDVTLVCSNGTTKLAKVARPLDCQCQR